MSRLVMISLNDRGNLGARQLVALAKREGHEAFLVNFGEYDHQHYQFSELPDSVEPAACKSYVALDELLPRLRPDLVGISYRSSMAKLAFNVGCVVHTALKHKVPVIAGGIGATSDPEDAVGTWADAVCVGEGESVLLAYLEDIDAKNLPLKGITLSPKRLFCDDPKPGLYIPRFENNRVMFLDQGQLHANLDSLPFPDYTAETTWSIVRGEVTHPDGRLDNDIGAYPLLTSRGCPRACSYCHNSTVHELYEGQKYCRQRSVENVMQEIAFALNRWGIKLLSIYDDLFIADPDWVKEFCRRLPEVWTGKRRFWCMAHPKYIRPDVIGALCEAGLEEICLGVQSGSERILKSYHRGTTVKEIMDACAILAQFPCAVKIDIISANPLETEEDVLATMDMLQRLPFRDTGRPHIDAMTLTSADAAHWHPGLSRLTIFPGSEISRQITQAQCDVMHTPKQDFIDGLYRAAFVPRWRSVDLADAMKRYDDFLKFACDRDAHGASGWPNKESAISDKFWQPLTEWLDSAARTEN